MSKRFQSLIRSVSTKPIFHNLFTLVATSLLELKDPTFKTYWVKKGFWVIVLSGHSGHLLRLHHRHILLAYQDKRIYQAIPLLGG